MSTQVIKFITRALLAAALLAMVSSRANATVYDLSQLASGHVDILYQWTFDVGGGGSSDLKDARSGDVHLIDAMRGTETPAGIGLGFDVSTDALRAFQVTPGDRSAGAALRTEGPLSLPSSGTVEYLFNVVTPATNGNTYIAGTNDASEVSNNRRYYGSVASGGGSVTVGFGNPQVSGSLLSSDTVPLVNSQWYYVALAFKPNLVNGYVANLTAGDTAATHTLVNLGANAGGTLSKLGLGCYAHATDTNHFLHGLVDQVSIYGSRLSHDEINAHVAAIQDKPPLRVDLDVYRNYPSVDPNWMPDVSSWQNDAFLGQSPTTTKKNPSRGQYGFTFDPSAADGGQMLTLNRNESLRVADIGNNRDMSVEMWLNADTIGGTLIDTRHTNYDGWAMTIREGGSVWVRFYERSSGTNRDWTVESDPGLIKDDRRYQHLVLSIDANEFGGGMATFYVDGQEWGTAAYSNASTYVDPITAPIRIGHQALGITTSMTPFHGEISGFALYAKALDHGEVLARFALGVPEPATAVMALFGALFLLATRRRARGAIE
ncbi:MAG: LamG-like jellyroll fold domain-containing protein [Thermoguttaceae bacterium]|jgi:hypothetical protein|nr:LamG-like jellyroll fold domain-containing protein [Thermoguttaceae bacterium]